MRILKFGGTSMGDEHTWRKVLDIIHRYDAPVVVVSATARTTRRLITSAQTVVDDLPLAEAIRQEIKQRHTDLIRNFMANYPEEKTRRVYADCLEWIDRCDRELERYLQTISIAGSLTPELTDAVASIGERLSSYLLACCGTCYGIETKWIDARRVIKTDDEFGNANPNIEQINESARLIAEDVHTNFIPVMGGYYGENEQGRITTLGFEGSDFTASLLGAALDAEAIEIWTDVSGIYTCDPRVVSEPHSIPELSFREATELAYFGAKVLHPLTMKPASQKNIPVLVKNIFDAGHPGTRIHEHSKSHGPIRALTFLDDINILTVTSSDAMKGYRFLANVFSVLADYRTPVDAVTTTEASISVALKANDKFAGIIEELSAFGDVSHEEGFGLISLIGCTFNTMDTISKNVINVISDVEPAMFSFSRKKENLNIVVPKPVLISAVQAIHRQLFPAKAEKEA